jgi:hypothetical protein
MFKWTKNTDTGEYRKLLSARSQPTMTNRRAINMMPAQTEGLDNRIIYTGSVHFYRLVIELEAKEYTGCLVLLCPKQRSRALVLLYKGHVVGCIFGSKNLAVQTLGADAYQYILIDVAQIGNVIELYEIPEEIVLAAASMFSGEVVSQANSAVNVFDHAYDRIIQSNLPGCIVVNAKANETAFICYFNSGKLIGVNSSYKGWIEANKANAMQLLKSIRTPTIMASILPEAQAKDLKKYGFSMAGIDAKPRSQLTDLQPIDAISYSSQELMDMAFNANANKLQNTLHKQ